MKRIPSLLIPVLAVFVFVQAAQAKIDLTTLTEQDRIQTTIYNSADLTLVRDSRTISFAKGLNKIQFSWANTKIDPTSLALEILEPDQGVNVVEMSFPAQTKDLGIWHIQADQACRARMDITYFTSGISWQAFYLARLSEDETHMDLTGYVRVNNLSGEDYPNAQTRLVVGKVNLLDRIAALASRPWPFGRPERPMANRKAKAVFAKGLEAIESAPALPAMAVEDMAGRPKEIIKKGVAEFFVYTIEGTEDIPDGWGKRLVSFKAHKVPVENVFLFEQERFGDQVMRRLSFRNNEGSGLGAVPLPAGDVSVMRSVDAKGGMVFLGSARAKYTPLDARSRLDLGPSARVTIKPVVMDFERKNILFDAKGNLSGFDEVKTMEIRTANFTNAPARLEITRNQPSSHFRVDRVELPGKMKKIDQDSFRFFIVLEPGEKQTIQYRITTALGERKWQK